MTIFVGGETSINFDRLNLGALFYGERISASATQITMSWGYWEDNYFGNFLYDSAGNLVGGTLTGWHGSYIERAPFQFSDFSVPVMDYLEWARNSDEVSFHRALFGGADHITAPTDGSTLTGGGGNDTMLGAGGPDSIWGQDGDDSISGGAGHDEILGGWGANWLRGNEGDDMIKGGPEFDDAHGNQGNDTVRGGEGHDWVVGGQDHDHLYGEGGNDVMNGNLGRDVCYGGDGNDTIRGGQWDDEIHGGTGDDWLSGDLGYDTITGGSGADIFNTFGATDVDRVMDFNSAEGDRVRIEPGTAWHLTYVGSDTFINMEGGGRMVLVGVTEATLGDWLLT